MYGPIAKQRAEPSPYEGAVRVSRVIFESRYFHCIQLHPRFSSKINPFTIAHSGVPK